MRWGWYGTNKTQKALQPQW